jgi:UDP-N-acetylmuramoyl-tripeptide--D-alanyl-D-alanine ligase
MKQSLRACYDSLQQVCWLQARGVLAGVINGVSTDSRQIQPGQLFVALRGEIFDGNTKATQAVQAGARAVVMDNSQLAHQLRANQQHADIFLVPDSRQALAQLALAWRKQFATTVIAVTGSNGKTTVKEMIASILRQAAGATASLATQGNLNNEIGVPLTLFGFSANTRLAVIEIGMNHPGEIAPLAACARPQVALVNNAQREHQEFMQSVHAVAVENGAVLQALGGQGVAVFPAADAHSALWQNLAGSSRVITFGWSADDSAANPSIHADRNSRASEFVMHEGAKSWPVQLRIAGQHNVLNAMAAAACARGAGIDWTDIVAGLHEFEPVAGRLVVASVKRAQLAHTLIDDTYNANPDSVLAAIEVLSDMPHPQLLVLGDMGEVGDQGPQFHAEVGLRAAQRKIDRLYTVGELAVHSTDACLAAGGQAQHFTQLEGEHGLFAAVDHQLATTNVAQAVLIKGSRFMRMERVVKHLVQPMSEAA